MVWKQIESKERAKTEMETNKESKEYKRVYKSKEYSRERSSIGESKRVWKHVQRIGNTFRTKEDILASHK